MKKLGFFLVGLGVVVSLLQFFSINSQGVWWEILFLLAGTFASLLIPKNEDILKLGIHWRIAIIFAIISTFVIVWLLFEAILPEQSYSAAITCFTFGLLAFIFHYLDNRKVST
jgi:hypothetical protein